MNSIIDTDSYKLGFLLGYLRCQADGDELNGILKINSADLIQEYIDTANFKFKLYNITITFELIQIICSYIFSDDETRVITYNNRDNIFVKDIGVFFQHDDKICFILATDETNIYEAIQDLAEEQDAFLIK